MLSEFQKSSFPEDAWADCTFKTTLETSEQDGKITLETSEEDGKITLETSEEDGKITLETSEEDGKITLETSEEDGKITLETSAFSWVPFCEFPFASPPLQTALHWGQVPHASPFEVGFYEPRAYLKLHSKRV